MKPTMFGGRQFDPPAEPPEYIKENTIKMTAKEFLKQHAPDTHGFDDPEVLEICEKLMQAYADHLEETAWVTDGSLPEKIKGSEISRDCIIDCGVARNYVGYYHFGLNQWRHSNNTKPIEFDVLQYFQIPMTTPTK
jgi:hypothetical protein